MSHPLTCRRPPATRGQSECLHFWEALMSSIFAYSDRKFLVMYGSISISTQAFRCCLSARQQPNWPHIYQTAQSSKNTEHLAKKIPPPDLPIIVSSSSIPVYGFKSPQSFANMTHIKISPGCHPHGPRGWLGLIICCVKSASRLQCQCQTCQQMTDSRCEWKYQCGDGS